MKWIPFRDLRHTVLSDKSNEEALRHLAVMEKKGLIKSKRVDNHLLFKLTEKGLKMLEFVRKERSLREQSFEGEMVKMMENEGIRVLEVDNEKNTVKIVDSDSGDDGVTISYDLLEQARSESTGSGKDIFIV